MADVQTEHGYTRIADQLLDALPLAGFSAREYRVLLVLIRLTYGFGKTEDRIGATQIAERSGIDRRNIGKIIVSLERRGVLRVVRHGTGRRQTISIVKDFDQWDVPSVFHVETDVATDTVSKSTTDVATDTVCASTAVATDTLLTSPRIHSKEKRQKKKEKRRKLPRGQQLGCPELPSVLAGIETKLGLRHTAEEAAAWLAWIRPDLEAYRQKNGKPYRDLRLAARNWWRRVKPPEIEAARAAQENRRFQDRFGDRLGTTDPEPTPPLAGWGATTA